MRKLPCLAGIALLASFGFAVGGCASGSNSILPNPDKDLQKHRKEYAADAAKRSYPADAPKGGRALMRSEVDYQLKVLNVVNLANADWDNVEIWVNGQYVCALSKLPAKRQVGINFNAFYTAQGQAAPPKGVWINKVEVLYNGSLYDVTLHPAD